MKHTVLLGLGSNIGDRIEFITTAIRAIADLERTVVDDVSGVYHTEPVGDVAQDYFLNVCISVKTDLDVVEFHRSIKSMEKDIGRQQSVRWGPREIDIDILFFDATVFQTADDTASGDCQSPVCPAAIIGDRTDGNPSGRKAIDRTIAGGMHGYSRNRI